MFAISFFSFLTRKIYQKICTIFWQKDKNLGGNNTINRRESKSKKIVWNIFSCEKKST